MSKKQIILYLIETLFAISVLVYLILDEDGLTNIFKPSSHLDIAAYNINDGSVSIKKKIYNDSRITQFTELRDGACDFALRSGNFDYCKIMSEKLERETQNVKRMQEILG